MDGSQQCNNFKYDEPCQSSILSGHLFKEDGLKCSSGVFVVLHHVVRPNFDEVAFFFQFLWAYSKKVRLHLHQSRQTHNFGSWNGTLVVIVNTVILIVYFLIKIYSFTEHTEQSLYTGAKPYHICPWLRFPKSVHTTNDDLLRYRIFG